MAIGLSFLGDALLILTLLAIGEYTYAYSVRFLTFYVPLLCPIIIYFVITLFVNILLCFLLI